MANSLALLGDCGSMGVDTLTYVGNLYAECGPQARSVRTAQRRQLLASAASLVVLMSVTVLIVHDALARLRTEVR